MNEGAMVGDTWASLDHRDIEQGLRQHRRVVEVEPYGFVTFQGPPRARVRLDNKNRPQRHRLVRRAGEPGTIDDILSDLRLLERQWCAPSQRRIARQAVAQIEGLLAALIAVDVWLAQITHATVDEPVGIMSNKAATAREIIRRGLT